MKFELSISLLTAAASVAAAPTGSSTFKVKAVAAGSAIDSKTFNAAQNNIYLALAGQNAVCQNGSQDDATFYIRDGQLFLYATKAAPQQLYADRSGMGQGKLGYIRPGQNPPKNAELTGWSVDESGNLNLSGAGFIACPGTDAWSVWVNAGVSQPAGNSGCVPVVAEVVDDGHPLSCYYSESS
ncbi:unnamed protein product [Clonostachys rhizophaga]|uniref:Cell wall protein PhiA n=1 Tax=Clonostachys rhizophaga TaxID=160324 RepID=A0A9N9VPA0_9HYPO|nr:unnamed protein product [Clonostachys rhizophaga]